MECGKLGEESLCSRRYYQKNKPGGIQGEEINGQGSIQLWGERIEIIRNMDGTLSYTELPT